MNQCSSSMTALCVAGRKTYLSVMGASDRSCLGQLSLRKGLSLSLAFFPLQGNSCLMMDPDSRNIYIAVVPKHCRRKKGSIPPRTEQQTAPVLKSLQLSNRRQSCKQPNTKHLKFENVQPSWANLPYFVTTLLHTLFSKPSP